MPDVDKARTELLPLREPTYLILLSLALREKHGYAILKDVEALSRGAVLLSTSTLYEALARLLSLGLIERLAENEIVPGVDKQDPGHRGKPRKAYRLTRSGRSLLEAETQRMRGLVLAAQRRLREGEA